MKAGTLLLVAADVINLLKGRNLITPAGDFGDFSNIQSDLELIKAIESILTQHGVDIPGRVDKVLALIPLIADLVKG